jgi:hypothetical protein
MPGPRYTWVKTKTSKSNSLKPWEKAAVKATVDAFVEKHYRGQLKKPPKHPKFNYVVDYSTRWHGPYFYVTAKWACPFPNAISPHFTHDFARLGVRYGGKWNLWARRHNDEWMCLTEEVTLQECLDQMKVDPWFQVG